MKIKVVIPISGGKDSQGSAIWAKEKYGVKNCIGIFCDVGFEYPETYDHINYLSEKLGMKIITVRSKKYDGMTDLAKKKGRFPSTKARFCTEELKIKPMIDYLLDELGTNLFIVIDGIRAQESKKRSKQLPNCTYFKYYFEPYQTNSTIIEELSNKPALSFNQKIKLKRALERKELGKEDPKFYTYRKKEIFEFQEKRRIR